MYTFSGIDSSGKTTQIELLQQYCKRKGIKYYYQWGKGRATPGVVFLKELFRSDKKMNEEEKKEYRVQVYQNRKKKFLLLTASIIDLWWYWGIYYRILNHKYEMLICDRYVWDTFIDFKTEFSEFNVDHWIIWRIAKCVAPKPCKSFLFYITAEESFNRDNEKGDPDRDTLQRKIEKVKKYQELINQRKWDVVIDGMLSREEMATLVRHEIFETAIDHQ